ncbi:MAG: M48 family metallopeptidase [Candidatus Zixiibacteriota bacterium]
MKYLICFAAALFLLTGLALADSTAVSPTDSIKSDSSQSATSGQTSADDKPIYPLSPERQALRTNYARFGNIWRFADFFISVIIFCLFLFTGFSARLRDLAKAWKYQFLILWLYLILFLGILYVVSFPFDYYRNFVVESDYGFMNQSFGGWLMDGLKSLGLSMLFGIIPAFFLYFVIERFKRWWLVFSIGAIPVIVFFVVITPVVISPLFNKFEPLKDKVLESELLSLASKAGIEGSKVFEVDASKQSSKINAYVTGLFNTKRIVLYDTIIKGFTHDEIKFVMGHEMGHYVLHDVWSGLAIFWVLLTFLLWLADKTIHGIIQKYRTKFKFERLGDIASLPLVMLFLTVMMFFMQPIQNTVSRMMEHRADKFGMNISEVPGETAAIAFDKLAAYNLSDPDPSDIVEFWFYSHPALKKRMEFVRTYKPE